MFNYSFWADEAYVSGIASGLIFGKLSILQTFNALGYQKLYLLMISLFFRLFGISEFTARLPSLIFFGIGIIVIFLVARKLSNVYGGILRAFLYIFSHLNLAYATQAKPYSALETITLLVILLIMNLENEKNKRQVFLYHTGILGLLCIATLFHSIGVLLWILYFFYLISTFQRSNVLMLKRLNVLHLFVFIVISSFIFIVIYPYLSLKLFPYDHLYQVLKLFAYKYTIISVSAGFGFLWILKKNKVLSYSIFTYLIVVLILTAFQHNMFNIRYVLTLFGIMFLFFGIFWAKVGEKYDQNIKFKIKNLELSGKIIIPLMVVIILYITGYKIIRWPQVYYNPNIDKYGDVQIANYKDFYSQLKKRFPNYKNLYVVNDTFDVEYWYFGRYSNAYFMKFVQKPYKHPLVNAFVYGSLSNFKKEMAKHPEGFLIMEDWQSLLPDDVKEYAKKNLKLEFRVESLKEALDDPWPLALYSWGMTSIVK